MARDPKIINDLVRASSPVDLARQAGVTYSMLNLVMNGLRRPGVETTEALARALRVETQDVIEWSNTLRIAAARRGSKGFKCGEREVGLRMMWKQAMKNNKLDMGAKGKGLNGGRKK